MNTTQTTYQVAHTCKFCKIDIILQIDSGYDAIRDPKNLLHLAACSRCADYREKSNRIAEFILTECNRIQIDEQFGRPRNESRLRSLEKLSERFQRVVFQFYGLSMNLDPEFVRILIEYPAKAGPALSRFRKVVADMAADMAANEKTML